MSRAETVGFRHILLRVEVISAGSWTHEGVIEQIMTDTIPSDPAHSPQPMVYRPANSGFILLRRVPRDNSQGLYGRSY